MSEMKLSDKIHGFVRGIIDGTDEEPPMSERDIVGNAEVVENDKMAEFEIDPALSRQMVEIQERIDEMMEVQDEQG